MFRPTPTWIAGRNGVALHALFDRGFNVATGGDFVLLCCDAREWPLAGRILLNALPSSGAGYQQLWESHQRPLIAGELLELVWRNPKPAPPVRPRMFDAAEQPDEAIMRLAPEAFSAPSRLDAGERIAILDLRLLPDFALLLDVIAMLCGADAGGDVVAELNSRTLSTIESCGEGYRMLALCSEKGPIAMLALRCVRGGIWIEDLVVHVEQRGSGVARRLVRHVLGALVEAQPGRHIFAGTFEPGLEDRLFRPLGFQRIATLHRWWVGCNLR